MPHTRLALLLTVLLPACAGTPSQPGLLDHVGDYHRAITTSSPEAQRLFDQGLLLCYGFDHEEAARLFERAAELDPQCAMAYWGMALVAGPNINNPVMDEARSKAASEAITKAKELAAAGTPVERQLIAALARRYVWPPPQDRAALDRAYAVAMRAVHAAFPEDDDVATLFAESMMDLRPWDLWTGDGKAQPGTDEILATLNGVLAHTPDHPGANHYLIHSLESSPYPERGIAAADRLCNRVPGASHLVHMPGHIYMRVGRYQDAVAANQRAIAVDQKRIARVGPGGFYALYRAPNYHFLAWAAMYDGQSKIALQAARDTVAQVPPQVVAAIPQFAEGFLAAPYHAMVRFGKWEDLVREPAPPAEQKSVVAFWHYARALAFSSLTRVPEAEAELEAFTAAAAAVPDSYTVGNNTTKVVFDIARPMVEGEIEYRKGNYERAFALLREAVARDDKLRYDEPWGWMQPARHALGALLLEQGRLAEAEEVYRDDLERHPQNGWALQGLAEAQRRLGEDAAAAATTASFRKAWSRADVEIAASCYCRLTTAK